MLQTIETIGHYQKITDALVEMWHRGYRFDDLRLYLDGYLAALRSTNALEAFQINHLEEQAMRYVRDPSNFEQLELLRERQPDYY
jgi:hypothetical protein